MNPLHSASRKVFKIDVVATPELLCELPSRHSSLASLLLLPFLLLLFAFSPQDLPGAIGPSVMISKLGLESAGNNPLKRRNWYMQVR